MGGGLERVRGWLVWMGWLVNVSKGHIAGADAGFLKGGSNLLGLHAKGKVSDFDVHGTW